MTKQRIKGDRCKNCQTDLLAAENYCPKCGQKNDVRRLSVVEFILESMGNFFSYDSKIIQSLIPFFTKPGVLSRKYVDGEKARFVVPFRMYMFFSVMFFLVAGLNKPVDDAAENKRFELPQEIFQIEEDDVLADSLVNLNSKTDTVATKNSSFPIMDALNYARKNADSSSIVALSSLGLEPSLGNIRQYEFWTKFLRMDQHEFVNDMLDKLPFIIFLFMPFLAFALKFLYIRRDIYYSEHLTFLLQSNSMVFLLATLVILLKKVLGVDLGVVAWLFFSIYFLIAMKNFYQQGWMKTILKYILVGWSYVILLPLFGILSIIFVYYFY